MKTLIPFILLICGLGLAAFVWYGNKRASEKSDEERVLEAVLEQQEQARAESLMSDILAAPPACDGLTTGTVFRLCEMEPDVGEDWPDLMATTSPKERACLLDSFHQTNRHAFEIRMTASTQTVTGWAASCQTSAPPPIGPTASTMATRTNRSAS